MLQELDEHAMDEEVTHRTDAACDVKKKSLHAKKPPSFYRSLTFFLLLVVVAVGYFTNIGIGNPSAFGWDVWSIICPLGFLESLVAGKTFIPRAFISFVLIVIVTLLVGKAFCSWLCPMSHLQRWIPGIKKRKDMQAASVHSSEKSIPAKVGHFDSRHGVLLGAVASAAIFGFPVFCLICPVGLTFALVLLVMRLFAFGEATWTIVAVVGVLLVEVVFMRKWCHRFCPLGALLSLISKGNRTFRPTIDESKCIVSSDRKECHSCGAHCPEGLDIRRPEESARPITDCTKCGTCAYSCPVKAISFLPKRK